MSKFPLLVAALAGTLVGVAAPQAFAQDGSYAAGPRHRPMPPISGTLQGGDDDAAGAGLYDIPRHGRSMGRSAHREDRRYAGQVRRFHGGHGYGGYAGGGYAGAGYGGGGYAYGQGYAIPPAGGLGVYSPGAYGPGPRIIHIPGGFGTASQQWGCGCHAAEAAY